jgi:hypothetical protein
VTDLLDEADFDRHLKKAKSNGKSFLRNTQKKPVNFLRRIKICQIVELSRNRKRRLNMSIKSFSVKFFV